MQQAKKDVPWAPDCHRDEAALTRLLMNLMACGLRSATKTSSSLTGASCITSRGR